MSDSNKSRRGKMVVTVVIRDPAQARVLKMIKKMGGKTYTEFAREAMVSLAIDECYRLGIDYDRLVRE